MRLLVIHNFYRSGNASGENLSVNDEVSGLRARGWDVEMLSSDSDSITDGGISTLKLALRPIYSRHSIHRLRERIHLFQPDVALVENVFPLHSPAVIGTLHSAGIPVAAGVRSYRNWCAASTHFRDGHECTECLGSIANFPAVRHGCYQGTPLSTAPVAVSLMLHRSTWPLVDRFLPVSENMADYLLSVGIRPDQIAVRPNFVPDHGTTLGAGSGFAFAGRLTPDKGALVLAKAWRRSGLGRTERLTIAGSGPQAQEIAEVGQGCNVFMPGLVAQEEVIELYRSHGVVVMPSIWAEPFGRGVIEAASVGRASLVTNRGGLGSLVVDGESGWKTEVDESSMVAALRLAADPAEQVRRGKRARQEYELRFTENASLTILERELTSIVNQRLRHILARQRVT